jgi:hypothetical protein
MLPSGFQAAVKSSAGSVVSRMFEPLVRVKSQMSRLP